MSLLREGEPIPTARDLAPQVLPLGWREVRSVDLGDTHALKWVRPFPELSVLMSVERRGDGGIWWHVSLARTDRLPSWDEVVEVKELFMGRETCAMHMVPPRSCWLNVNPYCLHLWVRLDAETYPSELYRP